MKDSNENNKKNRFFIKGLVFILPVSLTCWIISKIIIFMSSIIPDKFLDFILSIFLIPEDFSVQYIRIGLGFFMTVLSLYLIGILISLIGKKFFNRVERNIFYNIPIFNTIYKTIKQIIESVSSPNKNSFKKVVMVEFPRKGVWTMGFVTGESKDSKNLEYYHVIVPTTPNPTSAFLLFISKEEVRETKLSIDEGIKTIISGGVLTSEYNQI
ncbi:MAG: hypothetical protein CMG11_07435 [Candidatus Marinimicrobia bacterium]|nr:hypothetical protein [Candidatus Neomarinimicrobiota bacterium]|tara:strand:- start:11751 stop:12386 length:636 start_codon:yes stop_codon:yes gene_type:complete